MELRLRGVKQLAGSIQPVLMEAVRGIHTQIMLLTAALCPQFQRLCFPRVWQVVALSSPKGGGGGGGGGSQLLRHSFVSSHCSRSWGHNSELARQDLCPHEANILVGEVNKTVKERNCHIKIHVKYLWST